MSRSSAEHILPIRDAGDREGRALRRFLEGYFGDDYVVFTAADAACDSLFLFFFRCEKRRMRSTKERNMLLLICSNSSMLNEKFNTKRRGWILIRESITTSCHDYAAIAARGDVDTGNESMILFPTQLDRIGKFSGEFWGERVAWFLTALLEVADRGASRHAIGVGRGASAGGGIVVAFLDRSSTAIRGIVNLRKTNNNLGEFSRYAKGAEALVRGLL